MMIFPVERISFLLRLVRQCQDSLCVWVLLKQGHMNFVLERFMRHLNCDTHKEYRQSKDIVHQKLLGATE
jgi:hypothetical protein